MEQPPTPRSNPVGASRVVGSLALACAVSSVACVAPRQHVDAPVTLASKTDASERQHAFDDPIRLQENDSVVRIVGDVSCTGTLIAEDLVLTAHHCVAARDKGGKILTHDVAPEKLNIELGGGDFLWGEVKVRAIVSPDCGYTTPEGDVAILVLARHLIGVPTVLPRHEPPRGPTSTSGGETIEIYGFGRCARNTPGIHQSRRDAQAIDDVRGGAFEAQASICPGDSGGPVYAWKTHDLLGVVSASVMDGEEAKLGRSIFTRLDRWTALFSAAREIADGADPNELPPFRTCASK